MLRSAWALRQLSLALAAAWSASAVAGESGEEGAAGKAEQEGNGDAAEHKGVAATRLVTLLLAGTAMGQGAGWTVIPGATQRWQGGTGQGA